MGSSWNPGLDSSRGPSGDLRRCPDAKMPPRGLEISQTLKSPDQGEAIPSGTRYRAKAGSCRFAERHPSGKRRSIRPATAALLPNADSFGDARKNSRLGGGSSECSLRLRRRYDALTLRSIQGRKSPPLCRPPWILQGLRRRFLQMDSSAGASELGGELRRCRGVRGMRTRRFQDVSRETMRRAVSRLRSSRAAYGSDVLQAVRPDLPLRHWDGRNSRKPSGELPRGGEHRRIFAHVRTRIVGKIFARPMSIPEPERS